MNPPETFGAALRRRRDTLGLTRSALAQQVGCAAVTLRKIEGDERRPSPELAERLAEQLAIAPAERAAFLRAAQAPIAPARARRAAPPAPPASGEPAELLITKLYPPPPRPNLVPRAQLVARLTAGLGHPLTLVAAPAGSGKTTLISTWLHGQARSFAWLSLDAGDNDPVRFVSYLVAALQRVYPGLGHATLPLLQSPQPPPLAHVLTAMLNAIAASPDPAILALDDYHLISAPSIHDGMAFVLEHLPPQLRLVIATRADPPLPLARMRARRQITEVRAADLRFSLAEASAFLGGELGFALRPGDVATLADRTEGWIAGLQLAALSLHDRDDIGGFIASFAGDDRYVLDYLTEEVLQRQPPEVHDFLLHTAILDRLCAPLCDLLTGRDDGQALLEQLDRANVFLIPLDNARRWYRYHHLFADLLRYRLDQEQPARRHALHAQASIWFEQHQLTDEAIGHALSAQDFARAIGLITAAFRHIYYVRSEPYTLLRWIDAIPAELAAANLRLGLIQAWCMMYIGRLAEALQRCDTIEAALGAAPERRELRGELATLRGLIGMLQTDVVALEQLTAQALELLPEDDTLLRGIALWQRGHVDRIRGDAAAAAATLGEAAQLNRQTGNLLFELLALSNQADRLIELGQLRHAYESCRRLQATVEPGRGAPPLIGESYIRTAQIEHEWGQPDRARADLAHGMGLLAQSHIPEIIFNACLVQSNMLHDYGEIAEAEAALHRAIELARSYDVGHFLLRVQAARARWQLRRGDLAGAWQLARSLAVDWSAPLRYIDGDAHFAYVRIAIAQGQAQGDGALIEESFQLLDRMAELARSGGRNHDLILVRVLYALALAGQRQPARATAALSDALALAAPAGYLRTFIIHGEPMRLLLAACRATLADQQIRAYADRLLDAFPEMMKDEGRRMNPLREPLPTGAPPVTAAADLSLHPSSFILHPCIEPLSEREREVLRLMAAARSNQEIAGIMVVSVNTVKTHVQHIYAKLNVTSRLAAVEAGRRLGLV